MVFPCFGPSTTTDEVATVFCDEIRGKNVLVTGTSLNGLGYETARAIARYANLVIITGYNAERLRLSEAAIKREFPSTNIRSLNLDLSSLAAVRRAAAEVNAYPEPIHVLIHNAAATVGPFKLTPDALESQIATDFIGPFLFTKLIAPKIQATHTATYTPRVVALTSIFHEYAQGIDLADMEHPDAAKYEPFKAYNEAKSAHVLWMVELSRRAGGAIHGYSVSPGVALTNLQLKPESLEIFIASEIITPDLKPNTKNYHWKTIPESAATTLVAAFDPRLEDKPGAYLDDCNIAEIAGPNILDPDAYG
ncbi:Short-chain dehydrogenase/reductase family protein [Mycena sanguinolenta]|uniref:Short-chain dehydrogenase/reductase family protein n=1 Tax=Mycena sanguinolenta TaxID=230812 RepID=A0A8H6YFA3_9AGAR|nr:Short-chain dehydrogenase/reductase family protein [Mycena sanguinolenta]